MKIRTNWQFATTGDSPGPGSAVVLIGTIGAGLALVNLLVAGMTPLVSLYLDVPGLPAFQVFYFAVQLGMVLALVGLLFAIITAFLGQAPAWKRGLVILLLGLSPMGAVLVTLGPTSMLSPMIHDITTDTTDPPEFVEARKLRKDWENSLDYGGEKVASRQLSAYPDIKPVFTRQNREEALTEATRVVKDLRWEFTNVDYEEGIIEAYDTSRIFGFVDDIVIRVRSHDDGSRVDIRSVSRLGISDLGKNAERIRQFIKTFRD